MVTVIVKIELSLPSVNSLKEKRRILKSLIAAVKNKFNVSIAEVADNDIYRKATLGAAVVANTTAFGHQVISKMMNMLESMPNSIVIDYKIENY